MTTRLWTALFGAVFFLLTGVALAEWYPNEFAGVSVYFPDHWLVEAVDDYEIRAATQDESVGLVMRVFEAADVEAAIGALENEVMGVVSDFQATGYHEETLNGMPAVAGEATGIIDGQDAEIALLVLLTPTEKALVIFGAGQADAVGYYREDINTILANITPL